MSDVKVHIEPQWHTQTVDVWVYRRAGNSETQTLEVASTGGDYYWPAPTPADQQRPAPSFSLPEGVLEALVQAAGNFAPPSTVQAEALADARAVRDRTLALVEHIVTRNIA